ncbi:sodium:solute symporter [Flavobacterium sp. HSC-61S13]|uniref:sodium:solute symporter n=1 Tax=Flavobacterium sp. HSC-61S13 TaxID=2910963 RepID=UPI00209D4350|nr:sodium:solute symporter [Flavobacterium sp. HSC-61S13]MCP1997240.1 SSS family transporter [Flavobacterium sp. HSC-61S13]
MQTIDWIVLSCTLLFIVIYGTIKTKSSKNVNEYILANKETPGWAVALSVMATQASAITFLSIPGQAYHDGMSFIQFYFGLPLAMIVICIFFIPLYYKYNVFTAYEFLERRFDVRIRSLAAVLFLVQRGIVIGLTIYAPAIILSSILGWDLKALIIIIGGLVLVYTVTGGSKAIILTQKQQVFVILTGLILTFFIILNSFPDDLSLADALGIAAANDKMKIVDFSFDPSVRYTFWNGITGGFFLMLAYFGTDQTQVGRYITAKSVGESQKGLIINALLKVPMQFFILLTGVLVFVFFQFHNAPLHFNPTNTNAVNASIYQKEYHAIEKELHEVLEDKKEVSILYTGQLYQDYNNPILQEKMVSLSGKEKELREQAKEVILKANPKAEINDKDYVFIYFIINYLPRGLIGLLLAVILCAAMAASASELNALAATTAIDLYKRNLKSVKSDSHYLKVTKLFTIIWGVIAILTACVVNLFENLIQLVNIVGSVFYGTVLGIFLVAIFVKSVHANAVFWGAVITQLSIFYLYYLDVVSFLWLNFIGAMLVVLVSCITQKIFIKKQQTPRIE